MPQLPIMPVVSPLPGAGASQSLATSAVTTASAGGGDGAEGPQGLSFSAVFTKQLKDVAELLEKSEVAGAGKDGAETAMGTDVETLPIDLSVLTALMLAPVNPESVPATPAPSASGASPQLVTDVVAQPIELSVLKTSMLVPVNSVPVPAMPAPSASSPSPHMGVTQSIDLSVLTASNLVPASPVPVSANLVSAIPVPVTATPVPSVLNPPQRLGAKLLVDSGVDKALIQIPEGDKVGVAADVAANGKYLPQLTSPGQTFADKLTALVEAPVRKVGGDALTVDMPVVANSSATQVVPRNVESMSALSVAPRVGAAEWGGAVGEKVVWMASQSHQVAELRLNPPNLGPLDVRLTISNDQITAMFVTHHPAVKEAIETALPRLREMLADNGIMLGNVTVGSESFSQQQTSDQWKANGSANSRGVSAEEDVMSSVFAQAPPMGLVRNGMVDIFA